MSLTFHWDKKNCLGGTVWGLLHAVPGHDKEGPEGGGSWISSAEGRSMVGGRWRHASSIEAWGDWDLGEERWKQVE